MMLQALCVFAGAGLGAVLRWRVSALFSELWPSFPLGTTVVNVAGSFAIGVAAGYFDTHAHIPQEVRLLLTVGFLGGFTTFSAFSLETANLLSSRASLALALVAAKLILCLLLTYAGLYVAKRFL